MNIYIQKNVSNLILDYDGVVAYKDESFDKKAKDLIYSLLKSKEKGRKKFILHINSQRGMSFFNQDFYKEIKKLSLKKTKVYFSGCGGSFFYDINNDHIIYESKGISKSVVRFLVNSKIIKKNLLLTDQNDVKLWQKFKKDIPVNYYKIINRESRLYWDTGYPGSRRIFKCTIDLPENKQKFVQEIIFELKEGLKNIKLDITSIYLDVTRKDCDKGVIIRSIQKRGMYSKGSFVAIGDNPYAADRRMLDALDYRLGKKMYFLGITNNKSGKDQDPIESHLFENFNEIMTKIFS